MFNLTLTTPSLFLTSLTEAQFDYHFPYHARFGQFYLILFLVKYVCGLISIFSPHESSCSHRKPSVSSIGLCFSRGRSMLVPMIHSIFALYFNFLALHQLCAKQSPKYLLFILFPLLPFAQLFSSPGSRRAPPNRG